MTKWVYHFGGGAADGRADMRNLLGGKGANLAEMSALVPPGFTATTEVCTHFYANGRKYPAELAAQVEAGVAHIEKIVGLKSGDPQAPLLVSVRSGARVSMPGMMDTVLNLGLNDETVKGLAAKSGDARFAYDPIAASSRCSAMSCWASSTTHISIESLQHLRDQGLKGHLRFEH